MAVAYTAKNPTVIILGDRSTVSFINDNLSVESTPISISSLTDQPIYSVGTMPAIGIRCLMYSVSSPSGYVSALRCCTYYDAAANTSYVFREVISPQIVYDKASNMIAMWFWTNFKSGTPVTTQYSEDIIENLSEEGFSVDSSVVRALCFSMGSVQKYKITGGEVDPNSTLEPVDFVPVFNKPFVVQIRQPVGSDGTTGDGPAIVDFGAGGSSDTFPFTSNEVVTIYQALMSVPPTGSGTGEYGKATKLKLKPADIDVPSVGFVCLTVKDNAGVYEGSASYMSSPKWVHIDIGDLNWEDIRPGWICGISKDSQLLKIDYPGYKILATVDIPEPTIDNPDPTKYGKLALVVRDDRPVLTSVDLVGDPAPTDVKVKVLRNDVNGEITVSENEITVKRI